MIEAVVGWPITPQASQVVEQMACTAWMLAAVSVAL